MNIRVECYAGYRGEETPRRFFMGQRCIAVVAVQDRWLAPDHRYFKLMGDDGGLYIVRHDPYIDEWQLTCFKKDPQSPTASKADSAWCGAHPKPC
ncbi:hypothetical protein JCM12296A_13220 [Desulfosarcina cetonica]|uniref:hypothetical protein n=1 Tax=Desulfosarcina cetonica TaxID=90730 RepID=UPI0006D028D1|nr:hypothetical protein [Desulfosarcina cetonica]